MGLEEVTTTDLIDELTRRFDCGAVGLLRRKTGSKYTLVWRYFGDKLTSIGVVAQLHRYLNEGLEKEAAQELEP